MRVWALIVVVVAGLWALVTLSPAHTDETVVNVYNWSDYIGPDVLEGFTKETGIKVNYDVYDANETVEAKLAAGHSGYDVVTPTFVPFVARGIAAGLYKQIDKSKLKNYGNLDPALLAAESKYDPGNRYTVPWIAGTVGLGVNVKKIQELLPGQAMDSWDLLFKPENAAKLKNCGITVLDSPSDVIPVVLHYLHIDTDSEKPEDLQAATEMLMKIRPYIRKFD